MNKVKLGDVVVIKGGGTPDKSVAEYWGGTIPWASVKDFKSTEISTTLDSITQLGVANSATNIIPAGSIIVPTRMAVGKVAINLIDLAINQDLKALFPKSNIVTRYLLHVFLANSSKLEKQAYGATVRGITLDILKDFEIPLPPLEEQKRIAEILDRASSLISKRKDAIVKLDTLTQSIFIEMFGDPATNSKHWEQKIIKDIGEVITGNTPSRANLEFYGTAIEWIKSDNINTPHYYLTQAEEGLSELGKTVARIAPSGSILVTCIAGSPSCIGNAAIVDREVAFNQQINALVPYKDDVNFLFVQILIAKKLIQNASTASMKGMVNKSKFEQIKLLSPPLPLQKEFSQRVEVVEELKTTHRASLTELQALFASLQHRAFRGEL